VDGSASGLNLCEGDCDQDSDCNHGLICWHRDFESDTVVPGCAGIATGNWDYCVPAAILVDVGVDGSASGLNLCEGDCDQDSDCNHGLICWHRDFESDTVVPGCIGIATSDLDYCVQATSLECPLNLDTFLSSCSSNYDDLVAGIGTNSGNVGTNSYNIEENSQKIVTLTSANAAAITALSAQIEENSQNTVTLISANVADIAANAEDIAMIKSQRLNNQDATPGVIFDFSNKDLLIIGLLVINLAVIALSTYICVSGKAVKYQPVKAYGSE